MNRLITLLLLQLIIVYNIHAADKYVLNSPGKNITVFIQAGNELNFSIKAYGEEVLHSTKIELKIQGDISFEKGLSVVKTIKISENNIIHPKFYKKNSINNNYNGLLLKLKNGFDLEFRAFDDGVGYRFISGKKQPLIIENEIAAFHFPVDMTAYVAYVRDTVKSLPSTPFSNQFKHSFENLYTVQNIKSMHPERVAFLPALFRAANGTNICITEANLEGYPGMYLNNPGYATILRAVFPPYPKKMHDGGHDNLQSVVDEYDNFIAKAAPGKEFPWRVIAIAKTDGDLINNDMVYKLAYPTQLTDDSWIKPGKAAWDWWNDWGLYNVDFKSGINQNTYKKYIDFASANKLQYIVIDDGWTGPVKTDLFKVSDSLNLPGLIAYGNSKNVGLILWCGYRPFERSLEQVCKHYSEMGIKGFKVDFMDRDDQPVTEFLYNAGRIAAKYKLLLDFHGVFKPTGLQRTYPNVINFEGVHGLEQMKWSESTVDQVTYDVTMPFIRMIAGPVDYTSGAMLNASRDQFHPIRQKPMSQGTRCRQLASFIVFDAPLSMLADSPTNYERNQECTNFITSVPTVWDETVVPAAQVGSYIITARRSGNEWFIGAMTNWEERSLDVDLSFLGKGKFQVELFKDGINAGKYAEDYKRVVFDLQKGNSLKVILRKGGGFAAKITRQPE